jgi:hypothetical protein
LATRTASLDALVRKKKYLDKIKLLNNKTNSENQVDNETEAGFASKAGMYNIRPTKAFHMARNHKIFTLSARLLEKNTL